MNIYLDNAATTPVDREVTKTMFDWQASDFGNPSSPHKHGRIAKIRMEEVRDVIAGTLNCLPKEIVFTSGGTESNNQAIIGAALANTDKGKHLVISGVEHPSVISAARYLKKLGFEISHVNPESAGRFDLNKLQQAIRDNTILVSVMYVNNETGILFPVDEIARICRTKDIPVHCDAVQAFGKTKIDVTHLAVDLLSFSAHKIYGPKGIGGLYIREGTAISEISFGGGQEANRRAGTENLTGIVGLGKAVQLTAESEKHWRNASMLQKTFEEMILKEISDVYIVGRESMRSPYISNISFLGVDNQSLLLKLDLNGLSASVGSACSSGSIKQSAVLKAMELTDEIISSSVRFSFSRFNKMNEIKKSLEIIKNTVAQLRMQ